MNIQQFIDSHMRGRTLYHFTDTKNLDSINQLGILSTGEMKRRKVAPAATGGNQWSLDADKQAGIEDYIHLCFFDNHPMEFRAREEGRLAETRFLGISPKIMAMSGVRFSLGVANKSGVPILEFAEATRQMDLEVIFARTDWKDPAVQVRLQAARKYEVLVPKCVPRNYIMSGL